MSWTDVKLNDINPALELIPAQDYTFALRGAKLGDNGRLEVSATIADDGEFTGRMVFFSYPDPESYSNRTGKKNTWAARAVKQLQMVLGVDATDGETPVEYFNRVAGTRFAAPIKHSTPTEEYPNPRAELDIFHVRASA